MRQLPYFISMIRLSANELYLQAFWTEYVGDMISPLPGGTVQVVCVLDLWFKLNTNYKLAVQEYVKSTLLQLLTTNVASLLLLIC